MSRKPQARKAHQVEVGAGRRVTPLAADSLHGVRVDIAQGHSTNSFSPLRAFGACVDGVPVGAVDQIYTPQNLTQMLAAGAGLVSYRLFTELSVEAWHWNPEGAWSDPSGQGYWTGSTTSSTDIRHSYGYHLAHRGFTNDQGDNSDYSRLVDGDATTFWKSNPYLTSAFTGEPDDAHPQWVVLDLGRAQPIDAVNIAWADPFAAAYQIQYWTGADPIGSPADGGWATFPQGAVTAGAGGMDLRKVADSPIAARFLRILMTASSHTCNAHGGSDPRNCVGYAIAEIGAGRISNDGHFTDVVTHSPSAAAQAVTYASSVDPWHEAAGKATQYDSEQPGLDLVFNSGLTRGLPAMIPVSMLYGTPEDAAAELAYVERRGYAISGVELGEEPDGQYMLPEDYGALYIQWASALHAVDPAVKLGGPVLSADEVDAWPDAKGETSWLKRFIGYLRAHGHLGDLNFVSFEHYPFNPCDTAWATILSEPGAIATTLKDYAAAGVPANTPIYVTEYNFSFDYTEAAVDVVGAAWQADFAGSFLTAGGSGAFYYEYEPVPLAQSAGCYGGFSLFAADSSYHIRSRASQFFSTQLLTQEWAQPVDAAHPAHPAASNLVDSSGEALVTVYAVKRPDGQHSLLLINKDPDNPHTVTVRFADGATERGFADAVAMVTFGRDNYTWRANGLDGFADPDGPAVASTQPGGNDASYTLPRGSITVLRGMLAEAPAAPTGISAARFAGKKLTIEGQGLEQIVGIAVNEAPVDNSRLTVSAPQIIVRGKRNALGIVRGTNTVQLTLIGGSQTAPFRFQY